MARFEWRLRTRMPNVVAGLGWLALFASLGVGVWMLSWVSSQGLSDLRFNSVEVGFFGVLVLALNLIWGLIAIVGWVQSRIAQLGSWRTSVAGLGTQLLVLGLVSWAMFQLSTEIFFWRSLDLSDNYANVRIMWHWMINIQLFWLIGVILWAFRLPIQQKRQFSAHAASHSHFET